jgi:hypothetical protein
MIYFQRSTVKARKNAHVHLVISQIAEPLGKRGASDNLEHELL